MITINTMDPVIQWTHNVTLYPTCVTNYTVASNDPNITFSVSDPSMRNLNAVDLSGYGFPYCTAFYLNITPLTSMGPLASVMSSSPVTLIPSGEHGTRVSIRHFL